MNSYICYVFPIAILSHPLGVAYGKPGDNDNGVKGYDNRIGYKYAEPGDDASGSGVPNCPPRDTYWVTKGEAEYMYCTSAWVNIQCAFLKEAVPGPFTIASKIIKFTKTVRTAKRFTPIGIVMDIAMNMYKSWYYRHHNDCKNIKVVGRGSKKYTDLIGY